MYKFALFFLLIVVLAFFCFSCQRKEGGMDIGRPVVAGSPILVLNP